MKKQSDFSRLMGYAGGHRFFTYASWVLAAVRALLALVPLLGYLGAIMANPAAWVAACLFLYPAYIWTCRQLDNRLLAAKLHMQSPRAE